ncbi:hypothetical protein BDY19DRAFT_946605 [Irpex rosettiformis]|uniref:Uncharacterized protein n=1 Tax=Irpex rosettiformis TaxID=378272 RepID=A0ACB8U3W5_9APHY|nr:hypothetical protein BDY19DRAFT_946605 [Irpex rosettiformis]
MMQCKVCPGRVFTSMYAYNQHAQTSKAHCKQYPCTICFLSFPSAFARSGHLTKNHQDLLCRQCNRYYLSQEALQQHYRSDPNHPSCSNCEAAFPDKATLTHHMRVAHPAPLLEFACHPCQVAFEDQARLLGHFKSSGAHPLCLMCDQGLADLTKFDEHVKICHPELFCVICGVGCQSDEQLRKHYRSADDSLHPTCDICFDGFRDMASLKEHVSVSHDLSPVESSSSFDSDSYCLKCDVSFCDLIQLRGHYIDSPFHPTCVPCGEGFLDDVAYKTHLQDLHPTPPSSQTSSRKQSPALSPPRSLRSLITSPRAQDLSPTTSRIASPFPRTRSPTFFTSRSSRSTRSNSPNFPSSPHSPGETDLHVPVQKTAQGSDIEIGSVSPRPSSAPSLVTQFTSPRVTVNSFEPPAVVAIASTASQAGVREERLRPELRMPEPLCTVELMTPSVLGDESPTYESTHASTPEVLPTPSSLGSYGVEPGEFTSPSPAQEQLATVLASMSPVVPSPPSSTRSVPNEQSKPSFFRTAARTPSRVPMMTADGEINPAYIFSPTQFHWITESIRSSPLVTTLHVEPTAGELEAEMYRSEEYAGDIPRASRNTATGQASQMRSVSSATEPSGCTSELLQKRPPIYMSRTNSIATSVGDCMPTRECSTDSRTKVSSGPAQASWHCRLCMHEPHDPTVTMCGHLFCHRCIVAELSKNFQCPVCKKMMLVRLHVD